MDRFVITIIVTMLASCSAKEVFFELSNDPNYPQMISVSNVHYKLTMNKFIDVNATVIIYEEINDGTNVISVIVLRILSESTIFIINISFNNLGKNQCIARVSIRKTT